MRTSEKNTHVMFEIFHTLENRDPQRPNPQAFQNLFHPDIEFHWPPSLPYGGTFHGLQIHGPTWSGTWDPLQPSASERRMDPRVVAATDAEVVVLWQQRGKNSAGERIETPVLGLYQLRDGKLARAQMFYFDTAAVLSFLERS
jgi:ketosteroid isomerase-like protein